MRTTVAALAAMGALMLLIKSTWAHGFAGDRFFPPTITTDDPFAADEFALPTLSYFKNGGSDDSPSSRETDASFEFDKLILPRFSVGVSDTYSLFQSVHGPKSRGWQDVTLNMKYEVFISEEHEAIIAVGMESDIGGTGSKSVGRDPFTSFTPTLYFGKGLGDLPKSLAYLKPIAITATLGQVFETSAGDPNSLEWGVSLQYQIPYLQQHIQDFGIPEPFKNMIPLVEIAGSTDENRGSHLTTGTINPGVLYETKYFQVGAEALIPMNSDSGSNVGVIFQVWIFLDDIAPQAFGHPLFGGGE